MLVQNEFIAAFEHEITDKTRMYRTPENSL